MFSALKQSGNVKQLRVAAGQADTRGYRRARHPDLFTGLGRCRRALRGLVERRKDEYGTDAPLGRFVTGRAPLVQTFVLKRSLNRVVIELHDDHPTTVSTRMG